MAQGSSDGEPGLKGLYGKAFRAVNTKQLDSELRRSLVNVKLPTAKKAGTASNQAAAAATSWIANAAQDGFKGVALAWAGWNYQYNMLGTRVG